MLRTPAVSDASARMAKRCTRWETNNDDPITAIHQAIVGPSVSGLGRLVAIRIAARTAATIGSAEWPIES